MNDPRIYRRMLGYMAPYKALVAAGFLATLSFALLDAFSFVMLFPFLKTIFDPTAVLTFKGAGKQLEWVLEHTIGHIINPEVSRQTMLSRMVVLILIVFLIKNTCDFLKTYITVRLEQSIVRDLRTQVYTHLVELDLRFFGRTRAGQIIQRLTSDVDQLRLLLTKNLFTLLTSLFQVLVLVGCLLVMSVRLTVVALVILPALFGVWGRLLKRLKRGDRKVLELAGEVTSHLQETVGGIRQVKAATAENFEVTRFARLTQQYFKAHIRTERLRAVTAPMSEMIGALGTTLLLWYGARLVFAAEAAPAPAPGAIDGAGFMVFLALSLRMYQPAKWLSKFPATVGPGLVAGERIFGFVDTPVEMLDDPAALPFTGFRESLRFENVSFHYNEGEPVLEDISFDVRPGTVIALVGPSGGGKSTLADLVARFYDPTAGRITVDGTDLRAFRAKSWRAQLGIVTQETVLFHDTVRNNIAYAMGDVPQSAVESAAGMANAAEFISALPEGYDTVLGERATRLSGGQRQRVAIARAILRDPPILIFDEATSALDTESERLVQDAIENLLEGRTVFVIAHRLSTIRHADQILVIDHGRIVQRGTHDELVAQRGLYSKLHRLQFEQRVMAAGDAADAGDAGDAAVAADAGGANAPAGRRAAEEVPAEPAS
jgi:subfamily B ATP-binding cassette protein MsbA